MTKGSKKKDLEKCFVCKHSYKAEEIDEHMNGMTHHRILEQLYEKSRPHHCLACECVWNGLTLYRRHVSSAEHKKNIAELGKQRRMGLKVPLTYTTAADLLNRCKQRDRQEFVSRNKRKKQKVQARKAKQQEKAWTSKHGDLQTKQGNSQQPQDKKTDLSMSLNGTTQGPCKQSDLSSTSLNKARHIPATQPSGSCSSLLKDGDSSSRIDAVFSEPKNSGPLSGAPRSCNVKLSSEIDFSLDFTSDLLPPVGAMLFALQPGAGAKLIKSEVDSSNTEENASTTSRNTPQAAASKKRPQCPGEGPSSSTSERGQQEDPPRAPGLVKAHVKHISTILRRIRKSLDEEGLSLQPLTPSGPAATGDAGGETKLIPLRKLKAVAHVETNNKEEKASDNGDDGSSPSTATPTKPVEESHKGDGDEGGLLQSSSTGRDISKAAGSCTNDVTVAGGQSPQPLSRPGLPELLKLDLSRVCAKGGAHEPNLTAARRVRTVSSSQAGEAEKETAAAVTGPGLKPALEKLINSKAAKRKVNWKEIYQEHYKRKRLREKGTPRFGIELVSPIVPFPDDVELEEVEDLQLGEDFPWDALELEDASGPCLPSEDAPNEALTDAEAPGPAGSPANVSGTEAGGVQKVMVSKVVVKMEKEDWEESNSQDVSLPASTECQREEADQPSQPPAEPRKERQIDELLAVSLREEELNHSLLSLEDSLTQARTALQDAYSKVQHLMMVKEQTANDINTLRSKRIEILKIMRGRSTADSNHTEQTSPKADSAVMLSPSLQNAAPLIGSLSCEPPSLPPSTPSSSGQEMPALPSVPIKEEPSSELLL